MVQYAFNSPILNSDTYIELAEAIPDQPPGIRAEYMSQCYNQLFQSSGKAQSFSVLGIGIVLGLTIVLIILSMSLESLIISVRIKSTSDRNAARQADDMLHLLRMVLANHKPGVEWSNGEFNVPVTNLRFELERPTLDFDGLASYGPIDLTTKNNDVWDEEPSYEDLQASLRTRRRAGSQHSIPRLRFRPRTL
jgi:hypothetical protein